MTRGLARSTHAATVLVGGTGLVLAWMRYFVEPEDEFALVNHPLEPDVHALHLVLAPALVFACGVLWPTHVWRRIRVGWRARRRTGIALALLFVPMGLSGYLLQVSVAELWRTAWVWVHVGASCAWLAVYALHLVQRVPPSERNEPSTRGELPSEASPTVEASP